jgi:tetratricopeptide (TPR) repeat protein
MSNHLRKWEIAGLIATLMIILCIPVYIFKRAYFGQPAEQKAQATYVGREKCVLCHKKEYESFRNSHHDLAMDKATAKTVRGDFNDAVFKDKGIRSRFFRKDGKFMVHTRGPDGEMADFEITHTFGAFPLQQYLVPFSGGRLQCLNIAWDVEKKKWYNLPPIDPPDPDDWLHWTRAGQNWNGMCAECHLTRLRKGFDTHNNTFQTTWAEMDVSCEACHGPASLHVAWADIPAMARPSLDNCGLIVRSADLNAKGQLSLCARCHSRRTLFSDFEHRDQELLDYMLPSLLSEGLYYPDGQILEEVYVYGSFVQSKMYAHNVRCTDCHDVHSLKPHKKGNDLCLQCHRAELYNTKRHHFHKKTDKGRSSDGWLCVKCHMPGTFYMGIDYRPDHSIRVPRPDLSRALGVPNACNMPGCHADKPLKWSMEHFTKWYGIAGKPHYGTILAAGRKGKPDALPDLLRLAADPLSPVIVRATALSLLNLYPPAKSKQVLAKALDNEEALIRHTAISVLKPVDLSEFKALLLPFLSDPVRAVRMEAARRLAAVPPGKFNATQQKKLEPALKEYLSAMTHMADFPSGRMNLGNLYAALGKNDLAVANYEAAIRIDHHFFPAKVNLAMHYNQSGRNAEAEQLLREVLTQNPEMYEVAYSLGLLLAEMKKTTEAAEYIGRAVKGLPDKGRVHYNYGLLLNRLKRFAEAEAALRKALNLEPDNLNFLYALTDHYLKRRQPERAEPIARQMIKKHPDQAIGHDMLKLIHKAGIK